MGAPRAVSMVVAKANKDPFLSDNILLALEVRSHTMERRNSTISIKTDMVTMSTKEVMTRAMVGSMTTGTTPDQHLPRKSMRHKTTMVLDPMGQMDRDAEGVLCQEGEDRPCGDRLAMVGKEAHIRPATVVVMALAQIEATRLKMTVVDQVRWNAMSGQILPVSIVSNIKSPL